MAGQNRNRGERIQLMLDRPEVDLIDEWRHAKRMPSRAAALRELIRRGLEAEGFSEPDFRLKSKDFGVSVTEDAGRSDAE
jgi:hypothetical protein